MKLYAKISFYANIYWKYKPSHSFIPRFELWLMRYNNQWEIQESKVVDYKASEILKRSIMQVRLLVILNISDNNNLKITKGLLYASVQRAFTAFLMKSFITLWDYCCYYPHFIGKETKAWKVTGLRSVTGAVGCEVSILAQAVWLQSALIMIILFCPFFLYMNWRSCIWTISAVLLFILSFHSFFSSSVIIIMYIK